MNLMGVTVVGSSIPANFMNDMHDIEGHNRAMVVRDKMKRVRLCVCSLEPPTHSVPAQGTSPQPLDITASCSGVGHKQNDKQCNIIVTYDCGGDLVSSCSDAPPPHPHPADSSLSVSAL